MNKLLLLVALIASSFTVSAQDVDGLSCKEGKNTVRLEFENNASELELNKPTKFKVFVENIDLKRSAISGKGIRPLSNSRPDEFALFEVTVSKDSVTDGHFKMIFSYTPTNGGDRKVCTFMIPVEQ